MSGNKWLLGPVIAVSQWRRALAALLFLQLAAPVWDADRSDLGGDRATLRDSFCEAGCSNLRQATCPHPALSQRERSSCGAANVSRRESSYHGAADASQIGRSSYGIFRGLLRPARASAAGPEQPPTASIKVVSSLPRTGSAKAQTDTIVNGIRIAMEEADYRAGRFKIVYLDWDDATAAAGQWTAEAETANANRAVSDPDVMVYIGTYNSGAAKIAMPILNAADLLMVSPANTWPGLTKPGKGDPGEPFIYRPTKRINYVRVVPADDLQGPLGAGWAWQLGARGVYVLDDNEVYGKGIASLFREACDELGIQVLGSESIDGKAQEFRALMTKIQRFDPDLVYFGGTTQTKGGQLAKDLVAAGLRAKFMVPDACMEDAFIESAGPENVNGRCYVTFGGLPPEALTGPGKAFVERYDKRFGKIPEGYAIYGYEAGKVALEAIRRADKKDRAAITQACLGIKNFDQGALGTWSFDENGDTTLTAISGNIIENGKFKFAQLLTPVTPGAGSAATSSQASGGWGFWQTFAQQCLNGLTVGALFALIALGYTMVYGIVELINFAHGDVFMLGSCLALTLVTQFVPPDAGAGAVTLAICGLLVVVPAFCGVLNVTIDRVVYKPLRDAPKLAPLVSAIGVSFVLMNVGLIWKGAAPVGFPQLVSQDNLLPASWGLRLTPADLIVLATTVPTMVGLTVLVKFTKLGKAMRATAQNPTAARLMGIDADRVIGATFFIGGALGGVASVVYGLYIRTIDYQMGYQNGLYAFTAAVLGGIGNIPGAVLGGLVIGLIRALGSQYIGEVWTSALVFAILILILVFRPSGLLGARVRDKV